MFWACTKAPLNGAPAGSLTIPEIIESVAPYANETHKINSPRVFPIVFLCSALPFHYSARNSWPLRVRIRLAPCPSFRGYPQRERTEAIQPYQSRVAGQFESKHALSVPRQEAGGTERPPQNHVATERVAFVAAARFLGGQLFVSLVRSQLRREVGLLDGRAMPASNRGAVDAVFPQNHSHGGRRWRTFEGSTGWDEIGDIPYV